jgi:ribosomal protein L29
MKIKEVRTKSHQDLIKQAEKLRIKLAKLRSDSYSQETKNNREIRSIRKDLARTLSVINEKDEE